METRHFCEKKLPLLEFIFIAFLFALYLLPSVTVGSTLILGILLVYCAYLSVVDSKIFNLVLKVMALILLLAFFYAVLTDASSIAQNVSNREIKRFISKIYQYLTLYFPLILLVRINKTASDRQKKFLVALGIGMVVYVIATTWSYLVENPDATRDWESFGETATKDVANYYFIYAIPIIIAIMAIILSKPGIMAKFLSVVAMIVGIVFLVNAQYTLSILIAVIGILIQLFRNLRSTFSRVIFIGCAALFLLFLPSILEFFAHAVPSDQVSTRLEEIHSFITGKGVGTKGNNLGGRFTLYWDTVKAFFRSPIWGNQKLGFDGHATFLTVLSDTGILGGIPFYALLGLAIKSVRRILDYNSSRFTCVVIMLVMMGLTNPIHASMPLGFATWFLAPLMILTVFKEKNNETTVED